MIRPESVTVCTGEVHTVAVPLPQSEGDVVMAPNSKRGWKKRKRKQKPVTEQGPNTKKNRALISEVHVLNQEIDKVKCDSSLTAYEVKAKCQQLQEKIEALGGLTAYQLASKKGERRHGNFNSAQWVLKALTEHSGFGKETKIELLDVGAVSLNYAKHKKWINCTAIDLIPQQAGILQQDFFEFKILESEVYHVIVLSLVLNFVGTPDKRGLMLHHCHRLCKLGGYLFIVLPLPCLENSRYLDNQLFNNILENLGFKEIKCHNSKKLSFKMFQKESMKQRPRSEVKKTEVRNGLKCNNFCITLKTSVINLGNSNT